MRRLASNAIALIAGLYIKAAWKRLRKRSTKHPLPGRLTVTLTSYPPRYPTLALTIMSILGQSTQSDEICLWIAENDLALLPPDVLALQEAGLQIKGCPDLRSYKKLIPALLDDPSRFYVIADDDRYYPRDWLRSIVSAYRAGSREIICTHANRIRVDEYGVPLSMLSWELETESTEPSRLVVPVGIGGVLYEPDPFHQDVARDDLFLDLCPNADDIWFFWMARMNGYTFRRVGRKVRPINWIDSQNSAIHLSKDGTPDRQVRNMVARYGFTPTR